MSEFQNENEYEVIDGTNAVLVSEVITKEHVRTELEQGREDIVYLPIGLRYDGHVIRTIQIKEQDGFTEELQSSEAYRKAVSTIVDATLIDCIIDIMDYPLPQNAKEAVKVKEDIVKQLAEQDRQYVMMRIYRLEHGAKVSDQKITCRHCQRPNTVFVDLLEDLTINYVNEAEIDPSRDDRMILKDVHLTHPITIQGKKYDIIDIRIPDGRTSASLERQDNMGSVITKMILGMIAINTGKFIPSETDIKKWSKKVRHGLVEDLADNRIGFINSIEFTCSDCNSKNNAPIPVTNFLEN